MCVLDKKATDRAKTLSQDFLIHNLVNKPLLSLTPTCKRWEKPPCGFAKLNFDTSVKNNKTGYGVIFRDEDGFVIGGGGGFKDEILVADWAELFAFKENSKIV
ncbi:hypothetical protein Goklo_021110 [Gossypium klotzschianum]|uniref:RNase H type-1 domain-containing protein n=1 Tax=Gossypium klotzschianum TaxID=34286 RepID=A0A7J8UU47_9ROSI|nr:hypothetical protein [Gossypium klotzschianum]